MLQFNADFASQNHKNQGFSLIIIRAVPLKPREAVVVQRQIKPEKNDPNKLCSLQYFNTVAKPAAEGASDAERLIVVCWTIAGNKVW